MNLLADCRFSTSLPGQLPFETSGTTGRPVTWWRSRRQILTEAGLLIDTLDLRQVDHVITYAPRTHLYGFLFGSVIPGLLDVPVRQVDLEAPLPTDGGSFPLLVALPAAWWHLDRSSAALSSFTRVTAAHSSAALPPSAHPVIQAHDHLSLTEIHGSTESGMVATRPYGTGTDWTLGDDVTLLGDTPVGTEGPLTVHSPRLGWQHYESRPQEMTLGDRVQITGERRYRLIGRHSRLVKINGRRVDLAGVEHRLDDAIAGTHVRCQRVSDALRGEWYEVLVDPGVDPEEVAAACRQVLAPWESPRGIRSRKVVQS